VTSKREKTGKLENEPVPAVEKQVIPTEQAKFKVGRRRKP
jgi:hypothetical protein